MDSGNSNPDVLKPLSADNDEYESEEMVLRLESTNEDIEPEDESNEPTRDEVQIDKDKQQTLAYTKTDYGNSNPDVLKPLLTDNGIVKNVQTYGFIDESVEMVLRLESTNEDIDPDDERNELIPDKEQIDKDKQQYLHSSDDGVAKKALQNRFSRLVDSDSSEKETELEAPLKRKKVSGKSRKRANAIDSDSSDDGDVEGVPVPLHLRKVQNNIHSNSSEDDCTSRLHPSHANILSKDDRENGSTKHDFTTQSKTKKSKRIVGIIDSDSEDANPEEPPVILQNSNSHRFKSLIDSDSEDSPNEQSEIIQSLKQATNTNNLESAYDNSNVSTVKLKKKKQGKSDKAKIERKYKYKENFPSDNDTTKMANGIMGLIDTEDSEDDMPMQSHELFSNDQLPAAINSEHKQRMSAKQALENMRLIQSESQRMAREADISIPYHHPKQRSLKEFLARKTIFKPAINATDDTGPNAKRTTAAAIKMSRGELENYAKKLEEKAKEAREFYKSDSDGSDIETNSKTDRVEQNKKEESSTIDITEQNNKDESITIGNNQQSKKVESITIDYPEQNNKDESITIDNNQHFKKVESITLDNTEQNKKDESITTENTGQNKKGESITIGNNQHNKKVESITKDNAEQNKKDEAITTENTEQNKKDEVIMLGNTEQNKKAQSITVEVSPKKYIDKDALALQLVEEIHNQMMRDHEMNKNTVPKVKHVIKTVEYILDDKDSIEVGTDIKSQTYDDKGLNTLLHPNINLISDTDKRNKEEQNVDVFKEISDSEDELDESKIELQGASKVDNISTIRSGRPHLSGAPGMVIDFDETHILPKGVCQLMERFIKHANAAKKPKEKVQMSVLSAEGGIISRDVLSVKLDEPEDDPRNAKPGAALMKLRQELELQIAQRRSQEFSKRIKEHSEDTADNQGNIDGDCNTWEDEEDGTEMTDSNTSSEDEDEHEGTKQDVVNNGQLETKDNRENDSVQIDNGSDESTSSENYDMEEFSIKKPSRIKIMEDSDDEDFNLLNNDFQKNNISNENDSIRSSTDLIQTQGDESEVSICPGQQTFITTPQHQNDVKSNSTVLSFLSPVLQLTALQGMPSSSKSIVDLSMSPICDASPNRMKVAALQKKLFVDSEVPSQSNTQTNIEQLMDLCSGKFVPTIQNRLEASSEGFEQDELMGLCTGTFMTGQNSTDKDGNDHVEDNDKELRLEILSSSDEHSEGERKRKRKKKKLHKKKQLKFSDEESSSEDTEGKSDQEKCIDYDSEENEIEVKINYAARLQQARGFLEAEAELSGEEGEWAGSADEDERGLDEFEIEEGDADQLDSKKVRRELERIHVRQILDQDQREVRLIQELLLEDGENHGDANRDRKFRWKNNDTAFMEDDGPKNSDDDKDRNTDSDGEGEGEWRKMRHEREVLLRQATEKGTTEFDNTLVGNLTGPITLESQFFKSIHIVKTKMPKPAEVEIPVGANFLIMKNKNIHKNVRGSFLSRDAATLARIAALTRPDVDGAGVTGTSGGKGNFVFTALSPASAENKKQQPIKRKSDDIVDASHIVKKGKQEVPEPHASRRLLLDYLE